MSASIRVRHLPEYARLAKLLFVNRAVISQAASGDTPLRGEQERAQRRAEGEHLVRSLEEMGPTYIKLGQLLSSRVDLFPPEYLSALSSLQDHATPIGVEVVRSVIEEELGTKVSRLFTDFDERPLGAASLAQVHRAVLRDGRQVALKVQRPGVRQQVADDLEVIGELATAFDEHVGVAERAGLALMVDEFARAVRAELDYTGEAANLRMLASMLENYPRLRVPAPVDDLTTTRLLTMELVEGRSLATIGPLGLLELDGAPLADQLFKAFLDQLLIHGVLHADPHPGNVLVTTEGDLALVDVGMTTWITPELQDALLRLLLALGTTNAAEAASALERCGEPLDGFDRDLLGRQVAGFVLQTSGARLSELQTGRQLGELARLAVSSGLRPAPQLTMVGKALVNLDGVARRLAPSYEPASAIREHASVLMRHSMERSATPSSLIGAMLDAKEFAEHLPRRMNKVLDALAEGSVQLRVEGFDESALMRSIQKLANRAAAGLAVAAFVLAAAIFSISAGGPRWLGESAFSIVLLALALVLGVAIVWSTLRSDLPQRRARRRST
ncbi:MAG: AarF/UbiB family protein [Actinomycetota bacterium]|nr:AarF/UbiB family protein [Actinomycetota bacterium]